MLFIVCLLQFVFFHMETVAMMDGSLCCDCNCSFSLHKQFVKQWNHHVANKYYWNLSRYQKWAKYLKGLPEEYIIYLSDSKCFDYFIIIWSGW